MLYVLDFSLKAARITFQIIHKQFLVLKLTIISYLYLKQLEALICGMCDDITRCGGSRHHSHSCSADGDVLYFEL